MSIKEYKSDSKENKKAKGIKNTDISEKSYAEVENQIKTTTKPLYVVLNEFDNKE